MLSKHAILGFCFLDLEDKALVFDLHGKLMLFVSCYQHLSRLQNPLPCLFLPLSIDGSIVVNGFSEVGSSSANATCPFGGGNAGVLDVATGLLERCPP
jgi:hypothetical protein